uniref:Uncharacterized protein n=1 Tax=Felis catus TaxID=9685 RepID=A0ABI7Y150_FELCA
MESVGWNSSLRFKRMRKNLQETLVLLDSAPCGTGARVGVLVGERAGRLCSCLSWDPRPQGLVLFLCIPQKQFSVPFLHVFLPPSLPHSFPFCSRKARYSAQAKPSLQKVALGKACPRSQGGSVLGFVLLARPQLLIASVAPLAQGYLGPFMALPCPPCVTCMP